jgi:hypothetical protein
VHCTGEKAKSVVVEQLPVVVARVSRPYIGAALAVAIDVRGGTVLPATARCFGFCGVATCFGAPTTTLGSEVVPPEGVAVCDIAVPLRPHIRLATKSDENLIAIVLPNAGTTNSIPERRISRFPTDLIRISLCETISN